MYSWLQVNFRCLAFCRYVIKINAYDLGLPQRNSSEYVIVLHVSRNKFAPTFPSSPYTFHVNRTAAVGSNIGQVNVQDVDTVYPFNTWRLSVTGDGSATTLFGLRRNGEIYVRTDLRNVVGDEFL